MRIKSKPWKRNKKLCRVLLKLTELSRHSMLITLLVERATIDVERQKDTEADGTYPNAISKKTLLRFCCSYTQEFHSQTAISDSLSGVPCG